MIFVSEIFWFGFIGAGIPELIRLYKIKTEKPDIENKLFYFLINASWMFIGGLIAFLLKASNEFAALYIGFSWPVILSLAGQKKPSLDAKFDKISFIAGYRKYLSILF